MTNLDKLPDILKRRYEETFNESWEELEKKVRARNPVFFELYDALPPTVNTKKWKRIWELHP